TEKEKENLEKIEQLMDMKVPQYDLPEDVEISTILIPEEQPKVVEINNPNNSNSDDAPGPAFHEKSEKNKKVNLGGSYRREIAKNIRNPKPGAIKTQIVAGKNKTYAPD